MAIKPLGDRVIVKAVDAEEKTEGGIYIPDNAQEKPNEGVIVEVGSGTTDTEMLVKKGDKIMYGKYAGTEIEHEGEKYLIMKQSDIYCIID